jgi:hypothetical protein
MSSFARSTRFVVSVILFPFLNCWLRQKPQIFAALGFLRSQNPLLESTVLQSFWLLAKHTRFGIQARNRFFVTRSDNWDAFMLKSKPSMHSPKCIDTYFVLAPLATFATRGEESRKNDLGGPKCEQAQLLLFFCYCSYSSTKGFVQMAKGYF